MFEELGRYEDILRSNSLSHTSIKTALIGLRGIRDRKQRFLQHISKIVGERDELVDELIGGIGRMAEELRESKADDADAEMDALEDEVMIEAFRESASEDSGIDPSGSKEREEKKKDKGKARTTKKLK